MKVDLYNPSNMSLNAINMYVYLLNIKYYLIYPSRCICETDKIGKMYKIYLHKLTEKIIDR